MLIHEVNYCSTCSEFSPTSILYLAVLKNTYHASAICHKCMNIINDMIEIIATVQDLLLDELLYNIIIKQYNINLTSLVQIEELTIDV